MFIVGRSPHRIKDSSRMNIGKIDKVLSKISGAGAVVSGILIATASVLIFAYICNRQFIGQVWLFVEDWSGLSLVAIAYLGMAYTLRRGKHINVDMVVRLASPKVRNILDALISAVALGVLGYMLERSINWFLYTYRDDVRTASAMITPLWIPTVAMVVGMVILNLEMLIHFIRTVTALVRGSGETDGYLKVSD